VGKHLGLGLHVLCASSKKQQQSTLQKSSSTAPKTLRRLLNWNSDPNPNPNSDSDKKGGDFDALGLEGDASTAVKGSLLAGLLLVGVVGGFGAVGYIYREQINSFLTEFSSFIEGRYHVPVFACFKSDF